VQRSVGAYHDALRAPHQVVDRRHELPVQGVSPAHQPDFPAGGIAQHGEIVFHRFLHLLPAERNGLHPQLAVQKGEQVGGPLAHRVGQKQGVPPHHLGDLVRRQRLRRPQRRQARGLPANFLPDQGLFAATLRQQPLALRDAFRLLVGTELHQLILRLAAAGARGLQALQQPRRHVAGKVQIALDQHGQQTACAEALQDVERAPGIVQQQFQFQHVFVKAGIFCGEGFGNLPAAAELFELPLERGHGALVAGQGVLQPILAAVEVPQQVLGRGLVDGQGCGGGEDLQCTLQCRRGGHQVAPPQAGVAQSPETAGLIEAGRRRLPRHAQCGLVVGLRLDRVAALQADGTQGDQRADLIQRIVRHLHSDRRRFLVALFGQVKLVFQAGEVAELFQAVGALA